MKLLEAVAQDVRYALRMLQKNPGFALVAVLTLALGIGANTAIFSVVRAVLLAPLPYADGERLAIAVRTEPGPLRTIASYPDFEDWQKSGVFSRSSAVVGKAFFLETREGIAPVVGRRVSEQFFDVLGVQPMLGRSFLANEAQSDPNVAVISHRLWTRQLGSDPQVLGKELHLRGQSVRVIGVLGPDFVDPVSPLTARDLYTPLVASSEERASRNSQWLQVVGRLREGISLKQAAAQVQAISARALEENQRNDVRRIAPFTLISLREHQVGSASNALWLLLGAVGFVLLIACANVSNLLLARITARGHELAVRAALGASARRIATQLMTESLLLSLAGGACALLLVRWTIDLVRSVSPVELPRLQSAGLDPRVFGFALLITVAVGLLFGLLPVLRGSKQDVVTALKQATGTEAVEHARSRNLLLVGEIALTMVLLVGAALTLASFSRLLRVDFGFQTQGILAMQMEYAGEWRQAQQTAFVEQLTERVRALPGVKSVGTVDNLPFSGAWSQFTTKVDSFTKDARPEMRGKTFEYQQGVVGGEYFRTLAIPLKKGSYFEAQDAAGNMPIAIVSESLAKTLWGTADVVGHEVSQCCKGPDELETVRIVGVVGDVRQFGPETAPGPMLYRPLSQRRPWGATLVVHTEGGPAALAPTIRAEVRKLDSSVVVQNSRTMESILRKRTAEPRFLAVLLSGFGAMALMLAAVGIYGVVSYSVGRRTREIGVRIALGAQPAKVLRMVVQQGLRMAAIGIVIGGTAGAALSLYLRSELYEARLGNPLMYVVPALVVTAVTVLACYVPARRAAKVDPLTALRCE